MKNPANNGVATKEAVKEKEKEKEKEQLLLMARTENTKSEPAPPGVDTKVIDVEIL